MKKFMTFLLVAGALSAFAERQPYERYASIVDRQMFGPLPPGFDPTKPPSEAVASKGAEQELSKEQEQLQSAIHFSMINITPDGATAVGFTDNSDPKAPVNYYLKVGERRNGWEVKAADPDKASMTIAKGEVEVSLTIGGNSAGNAAATSRAGAAGGSASGRGGLSGGRGGGLFGGSLRARRQQRQREAEEQKAKDAADAAAREAERKAQVEEERAQREADRAEQRQQLLAIQEELRRVREAKAAEQKSQELSGGGESGGGEEN